MYNIIINGWMNEHMINVQDKMYIMYIRLNTPGVLEYFAIVINADNNCKEL